jgi:hypothetical protein
VLSLQNADSESDCGRAKQLFLSEVPATSARHRGFAIAAAQKKDNAETSRKLRNRRELKEKLSASGSPESQPRESNG